MYGLGQMSIEDKDEAINELLFFFFLSFKVIDILCIYMRPINKLLEDARWVDGQVSMRLSFINRCLGADFRIPNQQGEFDLFQHPIIPQVLSWIFGPTTDNGLSAMCTGMYSLVT